MQNIYFIARIDQITLNSGSISILLMRRITNINIIYHYIECVETVLNINIVEQKCILVYIVTYMFMSKQRNISGYYSLTDSYLKCVLNFIYPNYIYL